jgi:glycosyltransferase involved in cell wall biosynthesis
MYKTASQQKAIIRLHDPFKKSKDSSQNFLLNRKFKNVIARELRNHAFEKLLNSNSIFIANSFQTRSRFSEIYDTPIDRFKVIWPSVGFRNQVVLKDYKLDTHDNYVICVMSQRQRKNPIFVINSWAKVAAKLKYNLYVVGSIPLEALTAQALHFLNVGRIRILKSVETSELLTLQKNAMASVFASEGEGFGMPLAESMFFGVPVIHNDLDIFMEVCLDAGITFSLKSSDSLISIFEQLGQDEVGYQYKRQQSWKQGEKFSHEYAKTKWERVLGLK